ncbi:MAG: toxin-antitoxin system YwqK family antitoxin [Nitrososphaerales archaeon]
MASITVYHEGNAVEQVQVRNYLYHGPLIYRFDDGLLATRAHYHGGVPHGCYELWDSTGCKVFEAKYHHGKIVSGGWL